MDKIDRDLVNSESFEKHLLNDLMSVKILEVLFDKGYVKTWVAGVGSREVSVQSLPPPIVAILERSGVFSAGGSVSPEFVALIRDRGDFFYAKLKYLVMSMQDFLESAETMLWDPEQFMGKSKIFSSFDYSQGFEETDEARQFTKSWCHYVSALSRDESHIIARKLYEKLQYNQIDFILELGGNMGIFAEAVEKLFVPQKYKIIDIPQVCRLGQEAITQKSLVSKIEFASGDMFELDWTDGISFHPDLVIFKSVLHDWPTERAALLVDKACRQLSVGGALVIVERCEFLAHNLFDSKLFDAANIVFAPFYRGSDSYASMIEKLEDHKFSIETHSIDIDMRWFCLVARKV